MKILIDVGHPAHVHYYRNFCNIMKKKGAEILFTTRDKEVTIDLLDHYDLKYINFGKPSKTKTGKILGLFIFTFRIFIIALKFKPDFFLNASIYTGIVAWILRKPHISLEDTFNMEQVNLYLPFTAAVLTGDYPHPPMGKKEIMYSGYQELLYLHPKYYSPDENIHQLLGINKDEKYIILRFISWNASHDIGLTGLSDTGKLELIQKLSEHAKVFVSSEGALSKEMEKFRLAIPSWKIHDVLASAALFIGEGATMASECVMLGTPAIYISKLKVYTILEQQDKYGLLFRYQDGIGVLEKAVSILDDYDKNDWIKRKETLINDKIDVTAFLVWFVENWPKSLRTMKEDPEYQKNFK
jgi:uncharacterized protein